MAVLLGKKLISYNIDLLFVQLVFNIVRVSIITRVLFMKHFDENVATDIDKMFGSHKRTLIYFF